jgi:hypothetical protein
MASSSATVKWLIAWAVVSSIVAIVFVVLYCLKQTQDSIVRPTNQVTRKPSSSLVTAARTSSTSNSIIHRPVAIQLVWRLSITDLCTYIVYTTDHTIFGVEGAGSDEDIRSFVGFQSVLTRFTGYVWILPRSYTPNFHHWIPLVLHLESTQDSPSLIAVPHEINPTSWYDLSALRLSQMVWRSDALRCPDWKEVYGKAVYWCDPLYPWSVLSPPVQYLEDRLVTVHLQGRLGNVMFEVATAMAYAKRYQRTLVITDDVSTWSPLFDSFPRMRKWTLDDGVTIQESSFEWTGPLPDSTCSRVSLSGHMQSARYFDEIREDLIRLWYPLLKVETRRPHCLAIHVRRCDYTTLSHIHTVLPVSYYTQAILSVIRKDPDLDCIYVVSDDIEWCKTVFSSEIEPSVGGTWIWPESPRSMFEDLRLMMECQHHVIANSTFSWWGAYLGLFAGGSQGHTVAPKQWFQLEGPPKWSTIYLPEWEQL